MFKQLLPGMAAVAVHSKPERKAMKAVTRALIALASSLALAVGLSPVASADSPADPTWVWGSSFNCIEGKVTVSECAFYVVIRLVGNTDPSGCIDELQAPEYCDKIASDEKTWLWKPVTTWDIAQAVLRGYEQVVQFPNVASWEFSKGFAQSLYSAAQARVGTLFDPVTHEYLGTVSDFTKVSAPTISGPTKVGQILTAKANRWSPAQANAWQWYRGSTEIPGATGYKYKLVADDLGYTITVKLTGSRAGYNSKTTTSKATKVVTPGKFTLKVKKPKGTTKVGRSISASVSVASGATLTYQWYRNGKAISGATGRTYTLARSDLGKRLKVKVWASRQGYYTPAPKTSAKSNKVRKGDIAKVRPLITGIPQVGVVLTANPGTWKPEGQVALTYQWYRGTKAIRGATSPTYTPTRIDLGKTIKVKVTGKLAAYNTTSWYSLSTKKVADVPPPVNPNPTPSVP